MSDTRNLSISEQVTLKFELDIGELANVTELPLNTCMRAVVRTNSHEAIAVSVTGMLQCVTFIAAGFGLFLAPLCASLPFVCSASVCDCDG